MQNKAGMTANHTHRVDVLLVKISFGGCRRTRLFLTLEVLLCSLSTGQPTCQGLLSSEWSSSGAGVSSSVVHSKALLHFSKLP